MRKIIIILFLATAIIGLIACGDAKDNQYSQLQPTELEQEIAEQPKSSAEIHSGQSENQSTYLQTPASYEMLAGTVRAIDGMKITVDTTGVFTANETGQYASSGEPPEKQEEIIHLTEHTAIEVQTTAGGQRTSSREGVLEDLHLQAVVIVEGEWQDNEFLAVKLIIVDF